MTDTLICCSGIWVPGRAVAAGVPGVRARQEAEACRRHAHLLCGESLRLASHQTVRNLVPPPLGSIAKPAVRTGSVAGASAELWPFAQSSALELAIAHHSKSG